MNTSGARLVLLGPPCLLLQAGRQDFPETAPAYLGLFLAAQSGWAARETVAAYLWPDASIERSQHNLRVALNRLGALLQPWGIGHALAAERRRLRLDLPSDLADFRAAMARGDWAAASFLPGGPLLEGLQFAAYPALTEWLSVEREALRRSWRKALVEAAHVGADIDAALARYVAAHPSDGEAATLMAARRAAAGRPLEAQDVIAGFKRAAADELSPGELQAYLGRIEQTAAVLTPGADHTAPGAVLGRHAELAELDAALRAHRWVTVVGLPGMGKSALLAAWLDQRARQPEDEPLVRVAINERSSVLSVADHIVSALDRAGQGRRTGRSPLARLAGLSGQAGLVMLDGLDPGGTQEDLSSLFHTLRAAGPGLRVLAASRKPLGVVDEQVLRLRGLSVQRPADGAHSEAAQLFLREAQRMRPNHRWAELADEVERMAALCEGLPLALKLAAAWSRWLEPHTLAAELERSVRRTAGAFDGSLRAWLEGPWTRLTVEQQRALGAFSLFPGPFDMATAAATSDLPVESIEALLAQGLVDVDQGHPPQLRLHALVREFAASQLQDTPVQRRVAIARYLVVVDRLLGTRRVEGGQAHFEAAQVQRCVHEVMAAWPLALELGALEHLSTLADALVGWHETMGDYRAGAARLAAARDALDDTVPAEAALLARVQTARATLLYRASDYDAAEGLAREAQRLGEVTGQRRIARRALNVVGLSGWMALRLEDAKAAFEQGLASAVEDGEQRGEAVFGGNLALVEKSRGNYAAAEAIWRHAIDIDTSLGDWQGTFTALNNLANLLRHLGRFQECEALAQECLRITHEHALVAQRPFALIGLALLQRAIGRPERADQYLRLLDACAADSVEGPVLAGAEQLRAQLALDRSDGLTALQHIAKAMRLCIEHDDAANRAEALVLYGQWLAQHGGRQNEALQLWVTLWQAPGVHAVLKDQIKALLMPFGPPAAGAGDADLSLAVEGLLILASRHAADAALPAR